MESNNFGSTYTMDDIKKRVRNALIISIALIVLGVVVSIVLAVAFVGEDGYIRDDAPGEWLFVALIPVILGFIMLFVPLISVKKIAESNRHFGTQPGSSAEQLGQMYDEIIIPLEKTKLITVIVALVFCGVLLVLSIIGV
ncbi:hypothetical protein DSAG12_03043 [Promethearchaeum syntrophicum]|uniref:Uncharacterized protein n=1 Tax=Promethearchaeum syntrophicum TaxID=2594042 RepID=A0A5B9DDZ3_9ARCH|nr:hypothetical protein [Candidatus Prometheoarchaeum syntrophicum]QEE17211.1 hypothetical protein DSAG12_03043 [Candidatus Prometheoarchaeum syntrophicum]